MKLKYILGLIIAIVLSVVYYKFNPEVYHFFPECPFHKFLHLDCPGCGSQRAFNALLHLNIAKAIDHNLLLVLSIPFLLAQLSVKVYNYFSEQTIILNFWHKPVTPKIIFTLVMLFWIARNIPVKPFNYLAA